MAPPSYDAITAPIVAAIDAEMRAIRAEQQPVAPLLWAVVDHQFGWDLPAEAVDEARRVGGKKIRPLLMALVAQAVAGDYRPVLPAAAALEMLHNFTLIHDDVMDRSVERRHRPAVWTRWGTAQAINVGDGLYALSNIAITRLLRSGAPAHKVVRAAQTLSQACLWTCEGQVLDIDFEARADVTPDEYLTMIAHKSGALIEAAAQIGALLSTDDEAVIAAYAEFALSLGIAFQIRDDALGIWGQEALTGKSATSDLRDKKKTYPVLVAFARAAAHDRTTLQSLYARETLDDEAIATVLDILARGGAAGETDRVAQAHYERALAALDRTGIHNETQIIIRRLAEFLIQRAY